MFNYSYRETRQKISSKCSVRHCNTSNVALVLASYSVLDFFDCDRTYATILPQVLWKHAHTLYFNWSRTPVFSKNLWANKCTIHFVSNIEIIDRNFSFWNITGGQSLWRQPRNFLSQTNLCTRHQRRIRTSQSPCHYNNRTTVVSINRLSFIFSTGENQDVLKFQSLRPHFVVMNERKF